jgi:hypothetical protein
VETANTELRKEAKGAEIMNRHLKSPLVRNPKRRNEAILSFYPADAMRFLCFGLIKTICYVFVTA